jgi:hypothetical protein
MNSFQALTSSESNEWYTPRDIIQSAKDVMGGIDIDPASCDYAQSWIMATKYYTSQDDGMNYDWYGRLWLNPPYGKKIKGKNYGSSEWLAKAYDGHHRKQNITEGFVVGRGDSLGLQILTRNYTFVDCQRISFIPPHQSINKKSPVPGTRIFYLDNPDLPDNYERFLQIFSQYGTILKAV